MPREIYINLPVRNVEATRAFYSGLGFEINETFSDAECVCVQIAPQITVMALGTSRFADFTTKQVADAHQVTQVINCLSAGSRQEVDALVAAASEYGGAVHEAPGLPSGEEMPTPDGDLMYGRSFSDPDGHIWEVLAFTGPGQN